MAYGFGSRLIANIERKCGHLAIPGLLRWVGGFQLLVFILSALDGNYMSLIAFDRDKIFDGEVWRLFTYLVYPQSTYPLWILISIYFLWFISDGLEAAWGAFRVNLYLYATAFCLTTIGLVIPGAGIPAAGMLFASLVFSNLFFAFASLYPNQQIMLMMVIPIKVKYLAWIDAGYLFLVFLEAPTWGGPIILLGLLPYFSLFLPHYFRAAKESSIAASRKAEFKAKVEVGENQPFHNCEICGIDDVSHPEVEFRVTSDGEEYCVPCLTSMKEKNSSANPESVQDDTST